MYIYIYICFIPASQPIVGLYSQSLSGLLASSFEVSRSHTTTRHSRQHSSGRVISSSQRLLPDNTQHSQQTNIHCPRWDSNPQSQQARVRRPTPQTARLLGPATSFIYMAFHGKTTFKTEVRIGGRGPFNGMYSYHNLHFSVNMAYGEDSLKNMLQVRNVTKNHDVTKIFCVGKFKRNKSRSKEVCAVK